jgi:delta(3,5)-delta(2,4)-dienoyl-CoA isomerase
MMADEALRCGLVSRTFPTKEEMLTEAFQMAKIIATKSPVAIAGTKHNLNYSRGRPVADGLEQVALWNSAMLQTDDIASAAVASLTKADQPEFSKL